MRDDLPVSVGPGVENLWVLWCSIESNRDIEERLIRVRSANVLSCAWTC